MAKKIFAITIFSLLFVLIALPSVFAANDVKISVEKVEDSSNYLLYVLLFLVLAALLFFAVRTLISHFRLRQLLASKGKSKNTDFVMSEKNIGGEASFKAMPTDVAGVKAQEKLKYLESYLKEDERTIVNILKMKQGSCSQATMRVVSNFSKAKLSRLLKELEERGVIYKDSVGKKNIITLRDIN